MVKAKAAERFLTTPLLDDLDHDSRRAILDILVENHAQAGTILLQQGEPNDRLSFLIEGNATIERKLPKGRKETLATLNGPGVFGTTSFFRPNAPTVTVRATTDVCVLTLDHERYEHLRRHNPRAAEALALAALRVLAERFDILDQRVSDSLAQHADDQPKVTEWSGFRARLFEEPGI